MFFKQKKQSEHRGSNMWLPEMRSCIHQADIPSVLVEDEERVRRFWKEFFSERGMKLYLYDSEESFLEIHQVICFPVQFYFDQDFGLNRGVGLRLANLVKTSPYRVSTNLVTAYDPADFVSEIHGGVLDSVLPKFPSTLFGVNFFKSKMRQEMDERGPEAVVEECAKQVLQALEPLSRSNRSQRILGES